MQDQPKLILDDNSASNNFFYFQLRLLPTIHKSIDTPVIISTPLTFVCLFDALESVWSIHSEVPHFI